MILSLKEIWVALLDRQTLSHPSLIFKDTEMLEEIAIQPVGRKKLNLLDIIEETKGKRLRF